MVSWAATADTLLSLQRNPGTSVFTGGERSKYDAQVKSGFKYVHNDDWGSGDVNTEPKEKLVKVRRIQWKEMAVGLLLSKNV